MKFFVKIAAVFSLMLVMTGMLCFSAIADTKPAYTETKKSNVTYASKATAWSDTITVTETLGTHDKLDVALATAYWARKYDGAPDSYGAALTEIPAKFSSGDGLVKFEIYTSSNGPIWKGTEVEVLRITPSEAASSLTAAARVTGSFLVDWCGTVSMPFDITLTPSVGTAGEYTPVTSASEDYARSVSNWKSVPEVREAINYREKLEVILATEYWARSNDTEQLFYDETPVTLKAHFTAGDGLLEFEAYTGVRYVSEWNVSMSFELLRIIPTDKALALREDTIVTGAVEVEWCGYELLPFAVTVYAPPENAGKNVGELYLSAIVGNDITAVFELETEKEYDSVKFVASLGDDDPKTLEGIATDRGYRFEYTQIYAQCMTDVITGSFIGEKAGQQDKLLQTLSEQDGLSIASYCDLLYTVYSGADNKLITFIANMLEFGAQSQEYADYAADRPANAAAWVSDSRTDYPVADPKDMINNKVQGAGARVRSASLDIGNKISAKFQIYVPVLSRTKVTMDGKDVTDQLSNISGNIYQLVKENIIPTMYSTPIEVEVSYDGTTAHTLTYSVNDYLYRMNGVDSKLGRLTGAIYNYGLSAEQYAESGKKAFLVGMAVADITPTAAVQLEGYSDPISNPETDFTSDLKARIMVVDNGENRLVFINVEQVFSGWENTIDRTMSPKLAARIAEICDTATDNILLSNTHDHQSYMKLETGAEANIEAAVIEACNNLVPVRIGVGSITTQFGASRGNNYRLDLTKPYDGTMNVIRFDNAQTGEPIGLIYSVPMHNTMLGNGYAENLNLLSCEFSGYASRAIEQAIGGESGGFVAMHINGFYGNTTARVDNSYNAATPQLLKQNGERFAEEILSVYSGIETKAFSGDIAARKVLAAIPTNKTDKSYMENYHFSEEEEITARISLGAFGGIAYIGVNFEPFSVIATRLKAEAPYSVVLPAGNVSGWSGYIPTKETFEANETVPEAECGHLKTPFDKDGEGIFYEKIYKALCDLAGVDAIRTNSHLISVSPETGKAVYKFGFDAAQKTDKLVISFGQRLRTDCASAFDIVAYDANGDELMRRSYTDNGDNYVGIFTDGAEISSVRVFVKERFANGTNGIESLPVAVHSVSFSKQ